MELCFASVIDLWIDEVCAWIACVFLVLASDNNWSRTILEMCALVGRAVVVVSPQVLIRSAIIQETSGYWETSFWQSDSLVLLCWDCDIWICIVISSIFWRRQAMVWCMPAITLFNLYNIWWEWFGCRFWWPGWWNPWCPYLLCCYWGILECIGELSQYCIVGKKAPPPVIYCWCCYGIG